MVVVQKQNNMKTPFKMKGKSPMMKALIGNQNRLPAELKAKILASPATLKKGATSRGGLKVDKKRLAEISRKQKERRLVKGVEKVEAMESARKNSPKPGLKKTSAKRLAEMSRLMQVKKTKKESMAKMAKKSPAKSKTDAGKRLLKAVPNKKAYDKLSQFEKDSFNKAAKKAGLPTKKVPLKLKKKSPTKQTANRDKPKTSLTDKIKKSARAVGEVTAKATKKIITESPGGRLVSEASKYLAKRKKAKTGAKRAGAIAATSGALAKSNKKAEAMKKAGGSSAAEGLKAIKGTPRAKRMMTKKMKKLPKQPTAKLMARTEAAKPKVAKPKLTLNQKNKIRRDKQKKFLKK